jgi:hypothetical protein
LVARAAALRAGDPQAASADLVARVLREDPPATHTRRAALAPVDGVAAGEIVRVALAGVPFGVGPHACPGREHAIALACGALDGPL